MGDTVYSRGYGIHSDTGSEKNKKMAARIPYVARTVFVDRAGSVDGAYKKLNWMLSNEGLVQKIVRGRYYEKPTKKRERVEYEKCNRIYNKGMKRKVFFAMRQHPPLPQL